jgi:hypothetical protein
MDSLPQIYEFHGNNVKNGGEGYNVDLGEWMNLSMSSLYGNEFDFRLDTHL